MSTKKLTTNSLIETLPDNIASLERGEIAMLEYLDEHDMKPDTDQATFLRKKMQSNTEILNENVSLLKTILTNKAEGRLRFLDADPFRIAILRLKSAIALAEAVCKNV